MASSEKIRARIDSFALELAAELGEVDESMGNCWLDAVENQAVELGDALTAELARQVSHSRAPAEESACPTCGKPGRYRDKRQRELIGRRGPVEVVEPEYYSPDDRSDRR